MNAGPLAFICINAIALLAVPRRWAPLPFVMTACYLSISQSFEIGSFTFTAIRVLIAVGLVRVLMRGERLVGGLNRLDWWLLCWAVWACVSGLFHENPNDTLINRLGLVYNTLGIYMLLRVFCSTIEDVIGLSKATAILLMPVAAEMLYETAGFPSLFYMLEGTTREVYIRHDRVRAVGPFMHPILAGTVGAVALPLMVGMWNHRRVAAWAGIGACLLMVVTSASSGPIMSVVAAVAGFAMWRNRYRMNTVRWMLVGLYLALALAMKAPVYYLIARINFVDGSTGYHRALLIESAITYLGDWWLAGTDYTRHWASSPGFTPQHTDITNQYIGMAVMGGLPLMILFFGVLTNAFSLVGERLRQAERSPRDQFVLWSLGSALFAHCITFLSVSYFDQSFVFLYLTLAAIGSARMAPVVASTIAPPSGGSVLAWRLPRHAGGISRPQTIAGSGRQAVRPGTARPAVKSVKS